MRRISLWALALLSLVGIAAAAGFWDPRGSAAHQGSHTGRAILLIEQ